MGGTFSSTTFRTGRLEQSRSQCLDDVSCGPYPAPVHFQFGESLPTFHLGANLLALIY